MPLTARCNALRAIHCKLTLLSQGFLWPFTIDVGLVTEVGRVGVRGYAADRYAKTKDTDYKKVIRNNGLQLHSRSAVMETYGAFSKDLWSLVTVLTDPASHPHASGDYDPWCRPEPRRDFFLSLAFAAQRGGSKMLREAGKRRRDRRAAGRYATGTRA